MVRGVLVFFFIFFFKISSASHFLPLLLFFSCLSLGLLFYEIRTNISEKVEGEGG